MCTYISALYMGHVLRELWLRRCHLYSNGGYTAVRDLPA